MDKITESLCKADTLFGLRSALEKLGFSQEEDLLIAFKHEDKEYKTGSIPTLTEEKMTTLNTQDIKAGLLDWLNKAEMQEPFTEAVAKELGLPKEFDLPVTIKFMSNSMEVSLLGTWRCPCNRFVPFCCYQA